MNSNERYEYRVELSTGEGPKVSFKVARTPHEALTEAVADHWPAQVNSVTFTGRRFFQEDEEADYIRQMILVRQIMDKDRDILSDPRMDDDYVGPG